MIISKAMRLLSSVRKPWPLVLPLTAILLAAQAYGLAEQFRLSGVTKIKGRYWVNLVDSLENRSFWLQEGGRSRGYELLDMDYLGGFARIRKNDQTFIVNLKSRASVNPKVTKDELKKHHEIVYREGDEKPFTGTEIRYHKDGSKRLETPYVDGKRHGTEVELSVSLSSNPA